jgi:hypothetical protein
MNDRLGRGNHMAWYYGTYNCGHEGRVNIIGPMKDRQWKADRQFSKMCPECWERHLEERRQKANEESKKLAKEMELPELAGTPRQISWANTLRQELIEKFTNLSEDEETIKEISDLYELDLTKEKVIDIRDYIIESKISSSYYIDNRDRYIVKIIEDEIKDALKPDEEKHQEKLIEKEKIESIVYPEDKVTDVPVEISFTAEEITLKFKKNEDFRLLVKGLGYYWDSGVWCKELDYTTGDYRNRVAEVGNKLLNKGFPIMILDKKIRDKAIKGEYEKEHTRWIYARTKGEHKGKLSIKWEGYNESLYKTARSLPGSRWDSAVMVKVEYYKEVEEFAELYDFKFSKGARKLIDEYKKEIEKIETVIPAAVEEEKNADGLEAILNSSTDILEDLIDD